MKHTILALATVLLSGTLAACNKPEPAAPAAEPAATETAPAPAPEPAMPEGTDTTAPDPNAPAEPPPEDDTENPDSPHSGGDKVGGAPGN